MITKRDFLLSVAWRLRVARRAFGLTQAEFAKLLRVGNTAISNYEKSGRGFMPFTAALLKENFGIPFEWLYTGDQGSLSRDLQAKITAAETELRAEEATTKKRRPKSA